MRTVAPHAFHFVLCSGMTPNIRMHVDPSVAVLKERILVLLPPMLMLALLVLTRHLRS